MENKYPSPTRRKESEVARVANEEEGGKAICFYKTIASFSARYSMGNSPGPTKNIWYNIIESIAGGGDLQKSRNHVRITIGCFLFIGKKNYINFGSTIAYLNYKHVIIYNLV